MIYRKAEQKIKEFFSKDIRKALLVTGARQVGKTFIIRKFGRENYEHFVELNFLENREAGKLFEQAADSAGLLLRLSVLSKEELVPGKTLIFLDEIQESSDIITAVKFLVEEGSYDYILSGSLLGVDLKDIRSMPVGYMDIMEMYPLDFEEFARANKVSPGILQNLETAFRQCQPIDSIIHNKMMELFRLYLIVGGMPAAVMRYLQTSNIKEVIEEQNAIIQLYKKDIAKYDAGNKLYLEEIFNLIPSELNSKNKRFILKNLNENFKFSRYEHSFLWLRDAGVALPAYCASEPVVPLLMSKSTNLFKLFLADVGLLTAMSMDGIQLRILSGDANINFGAVYENVVAQELKAHGFDLYYFNSKKQGELDFLIEDKGAVLPIEVKSGKDFTRHAALSQVLSNERYDIPKAYVFHNGNVSVNGKVIYYPIYMMMFLQKNKLEDMIYKADFSVLQ